ncbi:MAG: aminopeptidase, partial [Lachnospiraceae bacterium]|nr:aminopeptidase [Lachnospiraceae bacterium]
CVTEMIEMAKAHGYRDLGEIMARGERLQPGDKVYANNRGKMLALAQIGTRPFSHGLNILGAHIDSPRLDLKPNPLYEDSGLALLKTHYYGGIKKYQWVTLPLALHGVVAKKDGTVQKVVLGEDPSDPVVGISDILPHLGKDQATKPLGEAIPAESLNVYIGSIPLADEKEEPIKKNVLRLLEEKYGMTEDDFHSAEIEVVPAGPARHYGLDSSMLLGYGHDDRICAYTSLKAQLDCPDAETTAITLVVDKEEIGSVGATGMHSHYFENFVADILDAMGQYSDLTLRRTLAASRMLSSDVSVAFDPNFPEVCERMNSQFFAHGPVLHKYTGSRGKSGSNDATAEYIASLRHIFDEDDVKYQMGELGKVDQGGGGTIAYILAAYAMDVIDVGIPLHSMHAPYEVASKPDIYETYRAYKVFLQKM